MARRDHLEVELLACLEHGVPQLVRVDGGVVEVDLVAHLAGPSGARDHHLEPLQPGLEELVIAQIEHLLAEKLAHELLGLGTLDLDRGHVDLVDLHLVAGLVIHPFGPQQHVGVGDRQPELVLGHAQQHRVVDYAALLVAQNDVASLVHRALLAQVPGHQQIGKGKRVRALDLDLPLDRDVPQGDVPGEVLVLLDQAALLEGNIGPRMVHVVVDRVGPAAVPFGQVPVRRLPDPRGDEHSGGAVAALPQVDGDMPLRRLDHGSCSPRSRVLER